MKNKKVSKMEKWLSKKLSINHKKAKLLLILASITMLSSSFVLMTLSLQNYGVIESGKYEALEKRIQNTKSLTFKNERN